jgi:ubiquinone biosynthesis protein
VLRLISVTLRVLIHLLGLGLPRRGWSTRLITSSPVLLERLGGAFPKIGQILSTRADLIGEDLRVALSKLQDEVTPLSEVTTCKLLTASGLATALEFADFTPVASATIAQVHKARRRNTGQVVALKLIRPGVRDKLIADCRIIRFFGRFIARLPSMSSIPVNEALADASTMLIQQADFEHEKKNYQRLHAMFYDGQSVIVPKLHEGLCTADVLVMDFIPDMKKLSDTALSNGKARDALTIGVRALYRMIFEEGFIHCDMHPGNVLVAPDGRVVILDAGFMVELTETTRRSFAEFFLAIAFRDGKAAARIVRETALCLPPNLKIEFFDRDIAELINRVGGLKARDFQVAGFVSELFAIMRKHHIYGTSQFTLIILSLLVYEGVTKQRHPELDFQQEAIPFVMAALAS